MWRALRTQCLVLCLLYGHLGALGVVCRVSGQFPIHASLQGHRLQLKYSRLGLAAILNKLMPLTQLVVLTLSLWKFTDLTTEGKLRINLYYGALVLCQSIILSEGWDDLCDLEDKIATFDYLINRVPVVTKIKPLYKGVLWIAIPLMQLFCNGISILFLWITDNSQHAFLELLRSTFFKPITVQSMMFLMYCSRLRWRTVLLQQSWIACIKMAAANNNGRNTLRLDHYRHLHLKLLGCVDSLNAAFGLKLCFMTCLFFVNVIYSGYFIHKHHYPTAFLSENIWLGVVVVLTGYWSSDLDYQGRLLLEDVFDIKITGLNHCLRSQLDLLVYQINTTRAEVKVPGLVRFSRGFVAKFTCSLVTYFILATQLGPTPSTTHPAI